MNVIQEITTVTSVGASQTAESIETSPSWRRICAARWPTSNRLPRSDQY
jgi:hypothetical protein